MYDIPRGRSYERLSHLLVTEKLRKGDRWKKGDPPFFSSWRISLSRDVVGGTHGFVALRSVLRELDHRSHARLFNTPSFFDPCATARLEQLFSKSIRVNKRIIRTKHTNGLFVVNIFRESFKQIGQKKNDFFPGATTGVYDKKKDSARDCKKRFPSQINRESVHFDEKTLCYFDIVIVYQDCGWSRESSITGEWVYISTIKQTNAWAFIDRMEAKKKSRRGSNFQYLQRKME